MQRLLIVEMTSLQGHHVARLAADLRDFLVAHDLQVRNCLHDMLCSTKGI